MSVERKRIAPPLAPANRGIVSGRLRASSGTGGPPSWVRTYWIACSLSLRAPCCCISYLRIEFDNSRSFTPVSTCLPSMASTVATDDGYTPHLKAYHHDDGNTSHGLSARQAAERLSLLPWLSAHQGLRHRCSQPQVRFQAMVAACSGCLSQHPMSHTLTSTRMRTSSQRRI